LFFFFRSCYIIDVCEFKRLKSDDFSLIDDLVTVESATTMVLSHCSLRIRHKRKESLQSSWEWRTISKCLYEMEMIKKKKNGFRINSTETNKNPRVFLFSKQRRKSFLWKIVTGDEKWILYDNSKRKDKSRRTLITGRKAQTLRKEGSALHLMGYQGRDLLSVRIEWNSYCGLVLTTNCQLIRLSQELERLVY